MSKLEFDLAGVLVEASLNRHAEGLLVTVLGETFLLQPGGTNEFFGSL